MMPNVFNGTGFEPYQGGNQMVGYPGGAPMPNMYNQMGQQPQPMMMQQPMMRQPQQTVGMQAAMAAAGRPIPKVDPRMFETPEIVMGEPGGAKKSLFSITDKGSNDNHTLIKIDNASDAEIAAKKKKSSKPRKVDTDGTGIVKVNKEDTTVEPSATIYSYTETNNLLHETLGQIDAINAEMVQEFNAVRHNRTMKNKYMVLNNLAENIGSLLNNRISTIKEINNCISKSNDMDYKKYKDIQAAKATMNDDKYVADVYQAFMANPQQNLAPTYQMPAVDPSVYGSGIVRANVTRDQLNTGANGAPMDVGYLNYLSNMTPEERLMRYESDPDVKQVIVYDASTGSRFFQVMNTRTGEVISGVPTYDESILEDTTLDLNTGIGKNLNLNESFPIIQINNQVTSNY